MAAFTPKPFGKYFLVEKIAIGGMAEIYKAKTFGVDGFEKLLAIKKILPHYSADKEFIAMLTDEAKLVVRLSHTNIVQIYDLGKVGDDYYISMEFIDGVNLREVINRAKDLKEKIPLPLCLYILSEMCKGLDYAHGKRDDQGEPLHIVHRDISPQNILISFEGETKIVDFGIAKAALNVSHTSAGILKGKVTYMSPEQAIGKPIDGRTDIFSAGIILYELITGERLFAGDSQIDILNKIRNGPIPESALSIIPDEVRSILAKALAFQLKDRYETAGDFQIALTKLLYSKYSDFSSKGLSSIIKKLFASELKIRKKKAIDEASIGSEAKQELEKFSNQKSLLGPKSDLSNPGLMADTTRPEDKISPALFKDTTKPEDKLHPTDFQTSDDDHAKTQLRINSGVAPLEDLPTSKSISVQFKQEKNSNKFSKNLLKITLFTLLAGVIVGGIYYFNPVLVITNFFREFVSNNNPVKEHEKPVIDPDTKPRIITGEESKESNEIKTPVVKTIDIQIATNEPGALIYKNGENTSLLTPATLKALPLTEKVSVILRKEGFEDLIFDIDPSLIQSTDLRFELKPVVVPEIIKQQPVLETTPVKEIPVTEKNQNILITNEDPVSVTKESPVIKQETKVVKEKIQTDKKKAPDNIKEVKKEIPKDKETIKSVDAGAGSSLRVDSMPRGASVTIDGNKAGITPVLIPRLTDGSTHTIVLSLPGYKTWSKTLKAGKGRIEISAPLQKD